MTIDINPALAVDLSKIINKPAEEKAKQLPDPKTYHMLCVLPEIEAEFDSGIVKSAQTMHFEEVLSPVLFVMKMGPDCYKDEKRFPKIGRAHV